MKLADQKVCNFKEKTKRKLLILFIYFFSSLYLYISETEYIKGKKDGSKKVLFFIIFIFFSVKL